MRPLSSGAQSIIESQEGYAFTHLFQLNFSSGVLYITDAPTNIDYNGTTWVALGGFVDFDAIEEGFDSSAGFTFRISGVNTSILTLLQSQEYNHQKMMIHLGMVTDGVITSSVNLGTYRMNGGWDVEETYSPTGGKNVCTITCRVVNRLGDFDLVRSFMTNTRSHQKYYPGDTFFNNVPTLKDVNIKW